MSIKTSQLHRELHEFRTNRFDRFCKQTTNNNNLPDAFPSMSSPGIFFTDGDSWREQRRFFLKTLHHFGFGRRSPEAEADIQAGLEDVISLLRDGPKYDHEKALVDESGFALCPTVFFAAFSNVLLKMLVGARLPREDQGVLFE